MLNQFMITIILSSVVQFETVDHVVPHSGLCVLLKIMCTRNSSLTQAETLSSNSLLFLQIVRVGTKYKVMVVVNVFLDSEKQFANNGKAMRKSNIDYTLSEQQYI
jgi:hypothetical protein